MATVETMGDRIRGVRARKRITQAGLAHMVGISAAAMNAIEGGDVDPRVSRVQKIAEALDVSIDYLVGHKVKQKRAA
jgi:transcriptional regulator with XRE-family HTH domain